MAAKSNCSRPSKRAWVLLTLAGLLAALFLPATLCATEIHYLRYTTFKVPFVINANQQMQIERVVLWVSENYGKTYRSWAVAAPSSTSFDFQAPQQGWYYFIVQAVYRDGRKVPQDPSTAQGAPLQPGLQIFVDTNPPLVNLRQATPRDGTLGIDWDIRDEYPDLLTLHVDYRPSNGANWIPVTVPQELLGQYSWTPTINAPQYDVRLSISDRAKNQTEKIIRVIPGTVPPQYTGNSSTQSTTPTGRVTMLNTRSIKINYDVFDKGRSDVSMIQVWATQDTQAWKMLIQEPPAKSPQSIHVTVEKEGRWGFKLIAKSGVGRGEPPPAAGHQPDFWVEIDESKPEVKILSTEMSGDAKSPRMTIRWQAQDKHLADRPISISYSPFGEGQQAQWTQLATSLPNDGQYIWNIPPDAPFHRCHLRIEAVDQAMNVGSAQTLEPVIVDLSIPKARVIGVEGGPAVESTSPRSGAYNTPGSNPALLERLDTIVPAAAVENGMSPSRALQATPPASPSPLMAPPPTAPTPATMQSPALSNPNPATAVPLPKLASPATSTSPGLQAPPSPVAPVPAPK